LTTAAGAAPKLPAGSPGASARGGKTSAGREKIARARAAVAGESFGQGAENGLGIIP